MEEKIRRQIHEIMDQNRIMTIATLRPDGWPQATTVGYAHEGPRSIFSAACKARRRPTWPATSASQSPSITTHRR